jgi:hypothetical protein
MRAKIEQWTLVLLIACGYLFQVPGLWRQGAIGIPALVIGGAIFFVLIALLLRASAGAALLIGALASLSVVSQTIGFFAIGPLIRGVAPPSAVGIACAMLVGYLGVDLWSRWRKKPNQSPEPTR